MVLCFFFFFSSRRRHTRSLRDWSSDVCSSDLSAPLRLQEAVGAEVARDFADPLGKDRRVLDPMPVAVDDGVREPLADLFGCMVRAHLAPPPTGELRFRMSV